MDKQLIERVARALHEAMRHTPALQGTIRHPWEGLTPREQSEYRAVTHSALVAAGTEEHIWVVTDETDCADDERQLSSVIVVAETRAAALAYLKESYGGADTCIWQDHDNGGHRYSTLYGEYTWVMVQETIERESGS